MTLPSSKNPVLDQQFHLHTLLRRTPVSATYRATHVSGHDAVIKLVFQEALFFDELARLYAMDASHFFSRCCYNYPPQSVTGAALPLDRPTEELARHDQTATGILVLEAGEGRSLADLAQFLDEREMVNMLMEVIYALRDLDEQGLGHGALFPENILIDQETGEIKLIDLGYHLALNAPARSISPEHDPATCPTPAGDIYMFAANLLPLLKGKGAGRKLRLQCMAPNPANRPTLEQVQQGLRAQRRQLTPKGTREILFGFLRPANLITWLVTIGLGIIILPHLESVTPPVYERHMEIMAAKELMPEARVDRLRALWPEADEAQRRALAADIAVQTQLLGKVQPLPQADQEKPIGVFVFEDDPVIIGRNHIYRIGDWVETAMPTGDRSGINYVADIQHNRFKLQNGDAFSWHYFSKPNVYIGAAFSNNVALIWDNANNLDRLMSAMAELMNLSFENDNWIDNQPGTGGGKVTGLFVASSPEMLLEEIGGIISIEKSKTTLRLKEHNKKLPVYNKIRGVQFGPTKVKIFAKGLERVIGYKVEVDDSVKEELISIVCYNITWQELLRELGLSWHVRESIDEKILFIDGIDSN